MMWSKKRVYADAASATPLSKNAQKELQRLLPLFGNPNALHTESVEAKKELEKARTLVAGAIGAHADEIVFTSGGTEANNLAIQGTFAHNFDRQEKPHAITTAIEHSSILEPLKSLSLQGIEVTMLSVQNSGLVTSEDVAGAIKKNTCFVSVQYINSEIGTIQPIRDIAKALRRIRIKRKEEGNEMPLYFHVDASQAPLWIDITVEKLGIDLLTLDGQKCMGPKGVGALYIKRGVRLTPYIQGGGQEKGLRSGTENVPVIGAFAVALVDALKNREKVSNTIAAVRNHLLSLSMKSIDGIVVHGAVGDHRVVNNLNISIPGLDGEMGVIALDAFGVAASTRSACDSSDEEPSHVLVAIGTPLNIIKCAIRITLLPTATKKDADCIASALERVVKLYRQPIARE